MAFRPDAGAFASPALLTERPIVGVSTDDEPETDNEGGTLEIGTTWFHEDTSAMLYYTGEKWLPVSEQQRENLKLFLLFDLRDARLAEFTG